MSPDDEVNQPVAIAYRPLGHPGPVGDINGDGRIDGGDLAFLLMGWTG